MDIQIKRATIGDLEIVDSLQLKLTDDQRKFDNLHKQIGKIRYQTRKKLEKILNDEKDGCFIALDQDKPVGFCLFQVLKNRRFWQFREKGYIADLYIEEEYRHLGIGTKLLNLVINHFKDLGLRDIGINVLYCNKNAIRAYEKVGFTKRVIEMKYDKINK